MMAKENFLISCLSNAPLVNEIDGNCIYIRNSSLISLAIIQINVML